MEIKELLDKGRSLGWPKNNIEEIIIRMGKVFGDICRWARNAKKDKHLHADNELKKELGNIIFSTIKWCDDLGYDPEECIKIAIECQKKFEK